MEEEIKENKKRKEELDSESDKLDKDIESTKQYQKRKNQTKIFSIISIINKKN